MSHYAFWPGKSFFYPIGNTPPVCLSQNIPLGENADILLLGCGDPRSILFTLDDSGSDSGDVPARSFDITCCDMEAGVLARNIILFSFLIDDDGTLANLSNIWNIFYNMYPDEPSHSLLLSQCRLLLDHSPTLDVWHNSRYGKFLRICTDGTLDTIRLLWKQYLSVSSTGPEAANFTKKFTASRNDSLPKDLSILSGARSAGPFFAQALKLMPDAFREYSRSGIVTPDSTSTSTTAAFPNPTFAFTSLSGDTFSVHYGTEPLSAFHLAEAFAGENSPTPEDVTLKELVNTAVTQFRRWCSSFVHLLRAQDTTRNVTIRFFAGEVLAFCEALNYYLTTSDPITPFYLGPWQSSTISLSSDYSSSTFPPSVYGAPTKFTIIETSNLSDHLGLLNVLMHTVSYTVHGSPVSSSDEPLLSLLERVCMDLSMLALSIKITPVPHIARFNTVSNAHEVALYYFQTQVGHNPARKQFHDRIGWKFITGSNGLQLPAHEDVGSPAIRGVFSDPTKLADALSKIYLKMFAFEDLSTMMKLSRSSATILSSSGMLHYTRRTFVQFLSLTIRHVEANWRMVIEELEDRIESDRTLITGSNFLQELYTQLHLQGVHTVGALSPEWILARSKEQTAASSIFTEWKRIPEVVCVVLVIPRAVVLRKRGYLDRVGTPVLQGEVKNELVHNAFGCVHIVHGTLNTTGEYEKRRATMSADPLGVSGSSPMLVTFLVPAWILIGKGMKVGLAVVPTPGAMLKISGMEDLKVFEAYVTDGAHVSVLAERPNLSGGLQKTIDAAKKSADIARANKTAGSYGALVSVEGKSGKVESLLVRVDHFDVATKQALTDGKAVSVVQRAACMASLAIGDREHIVKFPIPVDIEKAKLRVARKSSYVEVIASSSLGYIGFQSSLTMFPMFRSANPETLQSWNMHNLRLDRMPRLKLPVSKSDTTKFQWISTLLGFSLSNRERTMRDSSRSAIHQDLLLNVKESLTSIFLSLAEHNPKGPSRLFGLNHPDVGVYTLIFVSDLRLDCAAYSIAADAWVLPLTHKILDTAQVARGIKDTVKTTTMIKTDEEERKAWMRLLPAAVERCRTWRHKEDCVYLERDPPLTLKLGESPICGCGAGVGAQSVFGSTVKENVKWRPFAPFVTRAAISPLFAVTFLEKVGGRLFEGDRGSKPSSSAKADVGVQEQGCAMCGAKNENLLACGRCKKVKYCGPGCQRQGWNTHKLVCQKQ